MNPPTLREQIRAVMHANNLNEYTALRYLAQLAGGSERDAEGKAIVRDEIGRELARVIVPALGAISDDAESAHRRGEQSRRTISGAKIVNFDGRPLPVFTHSGRPHGIETKQSLLDIGIAEMRPLKPDFSADYSAPVEFRAFLPADPANGRLEDCTLEHFTTHPIAVALARRFFVLAALDEAAEGPITITSSDIEA